MGIFKAFSGRGSKIYLVRYTIALFVYFFVNS